jgi:hypothetical protein
MTDKWDLLRERKRRNERISATILAVLSILVVIAVGFLLFTQWGN